MDDAQTTPSKLARACWTVTAVVFLLAGLWLLLKGDTAYGIVTIIVALCAAINLF